MSDLFANLIGRAKGSSPQLRPLQPLYRGDTAPTAVALEDVETKQMSVTPSPILVASDRREGPSALDQEQTSHRGTAHAQSDLVPLVPTASVVSLSMPTNIAPSVQRKEVPGPIEAAFAPPIVAPTTPPSARFLPRSGEDRTPTSLSIDATMPARNVAADGDAMPISPTELAQDSSKSSGKALSPDLDASKAAALFTWDETVRDPNEMNVAASQGSMVRSPAAPLHVANAGPASSTLSLRSDHVGGPAPAVVEQDERVVTISIGRLEVKVTPTAKAAKSAATPTSSPGLAEYLRIRQGGGQ